MSEADPRSEEAPRAPAPADAAGSDERLLPAGKAGEPVSVPATAPSEAELEAKPVLEWTKDDWAAWVASLPAPADAEPDRPGMAQPSSPMEDPGTSPDLTTRLRLADVDPVAAEVAEAGPDVVDPIAAETMDRQDAPAAAVGSADITALHELSELSTEPPVRHVVSAEPYLSERELSEPELWEAEAEAPAGEPEPVIEWAGPEEAVPDDTAPPTVGPRAASEALPRPATPAPARARTVRSRMRSALALVVVSVVVGAIVAGLIAVALVGTALLLRRAVG